MPTILDELAATARFRVEQAKKDVSLANIRQKANAIPRRTSRVFEAALRKTGVSIVAEMKKASPSKGLILKDFRPTQIAVEYETGGADAVSCLTEPSRFLGSDKIFRDVRKTCSLPMLRKDFTVDEYQLYEAALLGADAVLLISEILRVEELRLFLTICDELGLSALVETRTRNQIETALSVGAKIVGVNNRNLNDFSVDFSNAAELRDSVPPEVLFIAESGVSSVEAIGELRKIGVDAALVGEFLTRSANRVDTLRAMKLAGTTSRNEGNDEN